MAADITEKPKEDDSTEHKLGRKEIIHLGFQNKTRGEAAFNLISYVGFGYFVVTATSVLATWLLRDVKPVAGKFEKWFTAPITKHTGISSGIMNILTLFAGGTVASVLPVKWLEDRKPQVVKKLDYMLYDENQFYNDPKIAAAHKELDEMPKQTWITVFGSRVVAFAATFAVYFTLGGNKSPLAKAIKDTSFAKKFGKSLDEMSIKVGRWLDGKLGKNNEKVAIYIENAIRENEARMVKNYGDTPLAGYEIIRDKVDANKNGSLAKGDRVLSRVYNYIGLDGFYTLITSVTLWVSTRIFGAVMGMDAKKAAAIAELDSAAETCHIIGEGRVLNDDGRSLTNTEAAAGTRRVVAKRACLHVQGASCELHIESAAGPRC